MHYFDREPYGIGGCECCPAHPKVEVQAKGCLACEICCMKIDDCHGVNQEVRDRWTTSCMVPTPWTHDGDASRRLFGHGLDVPGISIHHSC